MNKIDKLIEIIDRLQFFGGQRAGRELWADKPRNVQDADIAAYNRDMDALREAVNTLPRWVSVEEELPGDDDDVLMMTDMGMSMGYYCRDSFNDRWVDYVNSDSRCVTHWMPLPQPPEEDGE